MEDEGLTNVAPVADGPQVVYKHPEQKHKCYACKSMNGTDQEHHNQAAKYTQSAGVPRETTERWSKNKKNKTGFGEQSKGKSQNTNPTAGPSKKYLKFGADAHSSAKQARFTAAYTNRKKTVTIPAMVFNLPANSTT